MSIKQYPTITLKAATRAGYKFLTHPYHPKEYHLMEKVISDMKRGKIDYELVTETDNQQDISVWRKTTSKKRDE